MSSLSRLLPFALAGVAACGGDSTGPKAGSITGQAGDQQTGPTGATLATPISFVVLGSDGFPLNGAKISWSVAPASAATLNPKTQTTDATGQVSTTVTLGSVVGPLTVSANVNGVSPVQFHITALNPCSYLAPYSLGATVSGTLTRADCKLGGYFYDFYQLDLPTGQSSIRVGMASTKFDAYIELFRLSGALLGADDDIQQNVIQDAQLDIILGSGGTYVIGANSFDQDTVGAYTMTTSLRPTTVTGCQDVWLTPGVTIIDTIRTTDCVVTAGGSYFDLLHMFVAAGTVVQFAERSTAVNALLKLEQANFTTGNWDSVAGNNDSANVTTTTNAFLSYTPTADALLRVSVGAAVAGQTGEYTLVFSPSPGTPTAGKTAAVPQLLPFRALRAVKGWKAKL